MKKAAILLAFLFITIRVSYCQLLSKPSLTVEDFENALTNKSQLKKILKKHDFRYSFTGAHNSGTPGSLINPLLPDIRSVMSEEWVLTNKEDNIILKVSIYEWEPGHGPHPDVIKTIRLLVNSNSDQSAGLEKLLEIIRYRYPEERQRYYSKADPFQPYREVIDVFANNSKIEVRTGRAETSYGSFYTLSFDLIR